MKADTAPIKRVLALLGGVTQPDKNQWLVRCPAHDDHTASLSVSVDEDGTVALYCHRGCSAKKVCEAIGLTLPDLFPPKGKATKPTKAKAKPKPTAKAKPAKPITDEDRDEAKQAAKKLGPSSLVGFKLADVYPYRDASGKVWGWRARYESKTGGKQIKPFHHDGNEWVLKERKPPRAGKPLYLLPEVLAAADPVFIVEGEKCADTLAAIDIAATTSGAASSAGKADWTPLAGRRCIVWPDNDDPGEKYAADVAAKLTALGCDVSIIDVAALGLPNEGDDAADWLQAYPTATADDVLNLSTIEATTQEAVNLIRASDVAPKSINWLWDGYLARGMLGLLAGDGGTGKTTLALTIAAAITTGGKLPDGTKASRGSVIMWTGEDAIAEVLVPRLIEAGADLDRVHFVASTGEGQFFDPATDMPALEQQTQRAGDVALVIVDPIVSAIVGDSHKNAEVRRGLQPLMTLAANTGAAVIGITHYAKGTAGRKTNDRVIGSVAFSAVARVVLATVMGADGECRLVRSKSNIGPHGDGFTYSIEVVQREFDGVPASVSKIVWGPALFGFADELLGQLEGKRNPRDEAADWLYAVLQDGPVPSKELKAKAAEDGLAWRTIERAKEALTVVAERKATTGKGRGNGEWIWRLPNSAREAAQELRKAKYQ
ncbi:AAA family ATPase [Novilysobacter erysipheiresistens]|uniref:AAA family ATPase n=1 Tax=Novilysobacter erysipheiresistens TaxID=1749332 RepID=A0ABU7YUT4_9GAMM